MNTPPTTTPRHPQRQPQQKRILLADDDSGVRSSLVALLNEEGYVTVPARNGSEAIRLAHSTELHLIILDLNMPGKNGWETFEEIHRTHPLLPIIIITARANQIFTALGAGVGALLEKPLEIPILLNTISALLQETLEIRHARQRGLDAPFTYSARPDPNPHGPPTHP